ncbi:N-acetylglucosamine-6-phosphate deacetylase [Bacillus pseudomycoides]|uniref:N-acetylglucosamine-6-phosphate deacetylase n=1 Tax=Bacillus pseudomycoides TaxID=64104 RepID=A0AAJ2DLN3_9BACI|nr:MULTISPECIES: N-acetylglucosamine-6-phosphate deacetylase [Bacillus]KFN16886.1 N-acetylglucosamine-6-phosphate deacetylase [Bacillus pseudomycoides]MBD5795850.1 N-acetylglucosamine-6-phosphate deacetylase [Bacillus pseudomycoides]MBJ8029795.1 N-acetylglucosamine-6-phosphate deacetylase [Bacillus cereus group sp. N21]MCR8857227.1 N-acetylglucosamine-6-phosphate deacetylase [Bacillus pseudomycoides]MCX2825556.1 N-acetylglucosamine-6-phosphate deacetylase [Bacillus sp. DHT2]
MKTQVVINAKIYTGHEVMGSGFIRYAEKIEEIGLMAQYVSQENETVFDAEGKIVIPGMIDVHIHGGYDIDAMDANSDGLVTLGKEMLKEGVTTYFPTTMTQAPEAIEAALSAAKEAKEKGAHFEYIHLEGPYVSKKRAGAQPLEHIVPANIEQFKQWQEASGNLIKLVTYAPEEEGAVEFEKYLAETSVVGTMGHTDAVDAQLKSRNITHATHLYNQMRGLHHREPGVVGHVLLNPNVMVEVITDGIHIHPDMVKLAYKLKGPKKVSVITDAMRAKGLEDGLYELGGQPVHVKDGSARLEDGTLAGSILKMDQAFRNVIEFTGCSIEDAVLMTSVNQAEEFGLTNKGALTVGKDADFVVMTEDLHVYDTVRLGIHMKEGK